MPIQKSAVLHFMNWLEDNYALGFDSKEMLEIADRYEADWDNKHPLKDYVDSDHELVSEHQNMDGSIYIATCSCGRTMHSRRVAQAHIHVHTGKEI